MSKKRTRMLTPVLTGQACGKAAAGHRSQLQTAGRAVLGSDRQVRVLAQKPLHMLLSWCTSETRLCAMHRLGCCWAVS